MSGRPIAFVGTYGPADRPTIVAVGIEVDRMVPLGAWSGVTNPSFLRLTSDGRHLVAVSETGLGSDGRAGHVHSFVVDRRDHQVDLVPLGGRPSEGDHPCHVDVHPSGRWVAVSNYGSGSVTILPLGADGTLGDASCSVCHDGSGPHPLRQRGPHAHSSVFTPDGQWVISADLGADRVVLSEFDARTGILARPRDAEVVPGAGPRHIAIAPGGNDVFVTNELANTVTWYRLEGEVLTPRQTVPTVPPGAPDNLVAEIAFDAGTGRVYVSNRGHDTIAVFSFDAPRGLRHEVTIPCGGQWPRHFALLADDAALVVANQHSDRIDLVRPDGAWCCSLAVSSPTCVAMVPRRASAPSGRGTVAPP